MVLVITSLVISVLSFVPMAFARRPEGTVAGVK